MSEVKKDWLSVPWTLELVQKFPFGVRIVAGEREILSQHAYCHSTSQKTRQDNELGVGFVHNSKLNFTTVDEAQQHVAEQDAIARLISAAPDLLKALKGFYEYETVGSSHSWKEIVLMVESALDKAEGKNA